MLGDLLDHVTIVDHTDIFPSSEHLPTYNSHAIGACLHKIPNLSQHYLYMNDDVFFGAAVSGSTFFDEFGRSYYFPSVKNTVPAQPLSLSENASSAAARNNQRVLHERLGKLAYFKFQHTPIATNRHVMETMVSEFPEAVRVTLGNQYRSPQDHSVAGHFYMHYAAFTGQAVKGRYLAQALPQ